MKTPLVVRRAFPALLPLVSFLGACGTPPEPAQPSQPTSMVASAAEEGPRPEDNPFLDPQQRDLLRRLREYSRTGLSAEVWNRAGTLRRLEMEIEAPRHDRLQDSAMAFVIDYAALWKLSKPEAMLTVVSENVEGDCSTVVLQLLNPSSGLPVFNALLTVTITEKGVVRGVFGSLTGEEYPVNLESRLSAKSARSLLEKSLAAQGEPSIAPVPREMILDPFFYGDEPHSAQRGWVFTPVELAPGMTPSRVAAVGQATRRVELAGPVLARPALGGACRGDDPTILPVKVVLDDLTETPAWVDLTPLGSLETAGVSAADRALSLLSRDTFMRIFGDANPQVHMRNPREISWVDGRTLVTFEEHSNGRRVDGAYMQVVFNRQMNAETLFARYVYRPDVQLSHNIPLSGARATGDTYYEEITCNGDLACAKDVLDELVASPPTAEEVILSSRIFPSAAMAPKSETLAWRIEYGRRTLYVNAWTPNEGNPAVLLDLPRNNDAIPHDIRNWGQSDQLEIRDFVNAPAITPDPHSMTLRNVIGPNGMDAFFLNLNLNSFDHAGTRMAFRVHWDSANAMFCPAPCTGYPDNGIYIGTSFLSTDVVAHEFTHAITNMFPGLVYAEESGALNESYSDVFGNLVEDPTGPGNWLVGEMTLRGAIRDMATPGNFGDPGHTGFMNDACMLGDACVHTWSGVPNRAAVLVSDGPVTGSTHPGVGRTTLAPLYLETLLTMQSSDRFVEQQVRTLTTCRALVGQRFAGRELKPADCDFVKLAFREVGIDPQLFYGYQKFSTGLFGAVWQVSEHTGDRLFNGCTITDHILSGQDFSGITGNSDSTTGWMIDFGEWSASITSRGADTDPADRSVSYTMTSNWFHSGVARAIEVIARPGHITRDEDCYYELPVAVPPDPSLHLRRFFSTTRISHWASFLDGGRGDDPVNSGVLMPAGCILVGTNGAHDHRTVVEPGIMTTVDHGSHGFTMSRAAGATDPRVLAANAHWWHDGFSSIAARVVYDVLEPVGTDCSVPGFTQDTY